MFVEIDLDSRPVVDLVSELENFQISLEFRHALIDLFEFPEQVISLVNDGAIDPFTGKLTMRLEPTNGFRNLFAALRAGQVNTGPLINKAHD